MFLQIADIIGLIFIGALITFTAIGSMWLRYEEDTLK